MFGFKRKPSLADRAADPVAFARSVINEQLSLFAVTLRLEDWPALEKRMHQIGNRWLALTVVKPAGSFVLLFSDFPLALPDAEQLPPDRVFAVLSGAALQIMAEEGRLSSSREWRTRG